MICNNCGTKNNDNNLFCPFCGAKLAEDGISTKNKNNGKIWMKISNYIFYTSVLLVVLILLAKVVYKEDITYGYPDANSNGYYSVHPTKGTGEQWVNVGIYAFFKADWSLIAGKTEGYNTSSEVDENLEQHRQIAMSEYQTNINSLIFIMFFVLIVAYGIRLYIIKFCKT